MPATAIVLYENKEGSRFDVDYYLNTHMPLAGKTWDQFGFKSWRVVKFDKGPSGSSPAFTIAAFLELESASSMDDAMASDSAQHVFADVVNFTDIQPMFLIGETVGSG